MYSAMVVLAPMVSEPLISPVISRTAFSISPYSSNILSENWYTRAPASVRLMRLWVRSNRRVLKYSSSWRTWKVTAGWVMCRVSAALVKLSRRATVWKTCNRRSAMDQVLAVGQ